jgi:hypothetical protein
MREAVIKRNRRRLAEAEAEQGRCNVQPMLHEDMQRLGSGNGAMPLLVAGSVLPGSLCMVAMRC